MEKNISQEKRIEELEARLKEQEKLGSLGLLSAGIAHEIQNSLNFVINFSKLSGQLLADLADRVDEAKARIPEAELEELLQKNPEICIVTNELGYGVVPIEPFDRKWREKTGRICTELAAKADSVTRVVCGIGILLKGEEKHD